MKTPVIFTIVILAHCLAIGGIVLIQGCESTRGLSESTPAPVMPPTAIEPEVLTPDIKPVVTSWPSETTDYIVKKGDTVSGIAYRYGVSVAEIVRLNGLNNRNVIRVGQRLVLPGKMSAAKPVKESIKRENKTISRKPSADLSGNMYVVKPGDCLSVIAQTYGVKLDDIRQANAMQGDKIVVGQKLMIPGVKVEALQKKVPKPARPKPEATKQETAAKPVEPVAQADNSAVSAQMEQEKEETAQRNRPVITETHVVQKGEDLRRISMQWLVSESKIREFNNLSSDELTPGQVLLIPLSE